MGARGTWSGYDSVVRLSLVSKEDDMEHHFDVLGRQRDKKGKGLGKRLGSPLRG